MVAMAENNRPTVLAVHPTTDVWPANILRAHVVFDQPMEVANAAQYIKLIDGKDGDISDALLDLPDGLWTTDQRILTILFHPGRVKTGLSAGERYGSIFTIGRSSRLIVSSEIRCAGGQKLGSDYCHPFRVGAPIKKGFSPIVQKREPGRSSIRIETDQPLDFLSALAYLAITDEAGHRIAAPFYPSSDGQAIIAHLTDVPSGKPLFLRSHLRLEDIAGNRMAEPFETVGGDNG